MIRSIASARPFRAAKLLIATLLLALAAIAASAQSPWPALPGDSPLELAAECSDIRERAWASLLSAPPTSALGFKERVETNAWGRWKVYVDASGAGSKDAFYTVISPERGGQWPQYAQGTWIVKRARSDGAYLQAKIFLRSDSGTFARVYPNGSRSLIDIVAYDGVLYREVPLPLSFEAVLRSPFSRLRELSADVIDWSMFSPDPALYAGLRSLADGIRARLPGLAYAEDGAIDSDGRAVRIADLLPQPGAPGLNCSGFVKWLTDGILKPLSGKLLPVVGLRERMVDWRGSSFTEKWEERYDPFFGLDWSRALAREAWSALYPQREEQSPLAHDVNESPFALLVSSSHPVNGGGAYRTYSDNFQDAGFELSGLKAVFFKLAISEPGRWYLVQLNSRDRAPPRLRRYFHLAAVLPYFQPDGTFALAVFESAAETSIDRLMGGGYEFAKMVRMPVTGRFDPPELVPNP